jgi:hypothetical protein
MYPSSTCVRAHNRGSKGTFESLQQVVGAGWSPTSDVAKLLDKSWKCGGLLIFDEKESKQIRASMGKGMTVIQRFHNICDVLINLKWDMILPYLPVATCLRVWALNLFWESTVVHRCKSALDGCIE